MVQEMAAEQCAFRGCPDKYPERKAGYKAEDPDGKRISCCEPCAQKWRKYNDRFVTQWQTAATASAGDKHQRPPKPPTPPGGEKPQPSGSEAQRQEQHASAQSYYNELLETQRALIKELRANQVMAEKSLAGRDAELLNLQVGGGR